MSMRRQAGRFPRALGYAIHHQRKIVARKTQVELADKTGIDRSHLSEIEQGKINLSIEGVYVISMALGISITELIAKAERHLPEQDRLDNIRKQLQQAA